MNAYGLYKISEDLLMIFAEIEEAEGVLTPETEYALTIKQEELEQKCTDFVQAGKIFDGQVALVDQEIERLNKMKQVISNRTKRLDEALLQAVLLFGDQKRPTKAQAEKGKEGTKSIEVHSEGANFKLSNTQRDVLTGPEEYPEEIQKEFGEATVKIPLSEMYDVRILLKKIGVPYKESSTISVPRKAISDAIEEGHDLAPYIVANKHYLRKS